MNLEDESHHGLGDSGGKGASVAAGIVTGPPRRRLGQGSSGQRLLVMAFPIATPRLTHTTKLGQGANFKIISICKEPELAPGLGLHGATFCLPFF
jgi:hypothetical protein